MFQSIGPEFVAIDCEGCSQSSSAIRVTDQGYDDLFVFHADNHALSVTEGEQKYEGVENDSVDRRSEGNEVGTKPESFEDKPDVCDGELDLLVVGCR